MDEKLTLDGLMAKLAKFGDDVIIYQREYLDGSSVAALVRDGIVCASWRAKLKNMPPRDGVTPRGAKEYHDLVFYT